jgi:hypothetical protein
VAGYFPELQDETMNAQLIAVYLLVAVAVVYLARRALRTWFRKGSGCGGSCGCAASKKEETNDAFVPAAGLTLRERERTG